MKLVLTENDKDFAKSLSALARAGDDLWIGGDEGVDVVCMRKSNGERKECDRVDLVKTFHLPHRKPKDSKAEVDLEGMDWEDKGDKGYLWLIASHSRKRKAAKSSANGPENMIFLQDLSYDPHRFLLGRLALKVKDGESSVVREGEYSADHFPARLDCQIPAKEKETPETADDLPHSELSKALWDDALLGPFLRAGTPGKDNGLDIEGLAWDAKGERLLVGLRGPVLRGTAIILEMQFLEEFAGSGMEGRLKLKPVGSAGAKYRRHFVDLGGLSIRDLCFHGEDLLILAGPNIPIPWPATIFRWTNARRALDAGEDFHWQAAKDDNDKEKMLKKPEIFPYLPGELPRNVDEGNPEGLAIWKDRLLILRDAPAGSHFTKPATVRMDEVSLVP